MFGKNNLLSMSNEGGLGDKLLDLIGVNVLSKYLNCDLSVIFNSNKRIYDWGENTYDELLFNFNLNAIFTNKSKTSIEIFTGGSTNISPYILFLFLNNYNIIVNFEVLSNEYENVAKQILPSELIAKDIPDGLTNTYGIHLRKTDKVTNEALLFYENTIDQFEIIIKALLDDITTIITTEINPSFLIVSEDNEWKKEFEQKILLIANQLNNPVNIIQINYDVSNNLQGYQSVVDMFCLSKCKRIYQGVKYSTFSILSALIGNVPIVNYSHLLDDYDNCWIHVWKSVLNVNNQKCFDQDIYKKMFPKWENQFNILNDWRHTNYTI